MHDLAGALVCMHVHVTAAPASCHIDNVMTANFEISGPVCQAVPSEACQLHAAPSCLTLLQGSCSHITLTLIQWRHALPEATKRFQ
eukprot:706924-Amphidinium_carterae.1